MNEYSIGLSKAVFNNGTRSFSICTATVFADSEEEAINELTEHEPDWTIGKVTFIGELED